MRRTKRKFSSSFKTKVVLEALKEQSTSREISAKYEIHQNQISLWKREFLNNASKAFEGKSADENQEKEKEKLYGKIGQLQVENDFLKKVLGK
jgi:transposase